MFGLFLAVLTAPTVFSTSPVHWSFQPVHQPSVPKLIKGYRITNPIDSFVSRELSRNKLSQSAPADRLTLLRRLSFDLTGLPPSLGDIRNTQDSKDPKWYEATVKRLLQSPHFGERWAQHWLDVVRFGESNGYEHDDDRPQAWRYRDWVVKAINDDLPYDEFIKLQVAGDLIHPNDFNSKVATGFLRAGPYHITGGNLDPKEMRQEWLTEAISGIGTGVLGLSINCARCHDHKFDPISQREYYNLQSYFTRTANDEFRNATTDQVAAYESALKAIAARKKPIESLISAIEKPYRDRIREEKILRLLPEYQEALRTPANKRSSAQKNLVSNANQQISISWDDVYNALSADDRSKRAKLRQQIFALERGAPPPPLTASGVADSMPENTKSVLFIRGDVHNEGDEVKPGIPRCVNSGKDVPAGRLALAQWLVSNDNPLTNRVIVNRVWQKLFGVGIVSTPNDFGKNGSLPTNPDLLDWLAFTFQSTYKHSLKSLIFEIVTSETYKQSSIVVSANAKIDPDNKFLWRMNRKRLDAESLRDQILATSNTLNQQIGGPSVRIPLEPEVYDTIFTEYEPDNLWEVTQDLSQHTRRTIYLVRKRNVRLPMLSLFDQPDFMTSCAARSQSVHALQPLTLINSEFMQSQSKLFARRILMTQNPSRRLETLFVSTFNRPPSSHELMLTKQFIEKQRDLHKSEKNLDNMQVTESVWTDLCLATMNSNEYLYVR